MRRLSVLGRFFSLCFLSFVSVATLSAQEVTTPRIDTSSIKVTNPSQPQVVLHTNMGDIHLVLFADRAPNTVTNFLNYAESGFYDATVFHRVISGFMVQGGGYSTDYTLKPTRNPVRNEADNGLENNRGTVAMARTNNEHSATSQFFINHTDNRALNHRDKNSSQGWGYTVFGKVLNNMEVVDAIAATPTGPIPPFGRDVPLETMTIDSVEVFKAPQ